MEWITALLGVGGGLVLAAAGRRRRRWRGRHLALATWRVRCRDIDGSRAEVAVTAGRRHIAVRTPDGETLLFEPLQVGPLRAALRDATAGPARSEVVSQ